MQTALHFRRFTLFSFFPTHFLQTVCNSFVISEHSFYYDAIIVAVTEGPVREEQLLHDMCLLGAVTVEITQILTRAGFTFDASISEPLLR
jgi:hypothetical protein